MQSSKVQSVLLVHRRPSCLCGLPAQPTNITCWTSFIAFWATRNPFLVCFPLSLATSCGQGSNSEDVPCCQLLNADQNCLARGAGPQLWEIGFSLLHLAERQFIFAADLAQDEWKGRWSKTFWSTLPFRTYSGPHTVHAALLCITGC